MSLTAHQRSSRAAQEARAHPPCRAGLEAWRPALCQAIRTALKRGTGERVVVAFFAQVGGVPTAEVESYVASLRAAEREAA
jgi:hypothetical protein